MPDNIYPDQSNDKFDIQYARLLGLSSDLRASFGVFTDSELPAGIPFETPDDNSQGIVHFAVAGEDDLAGENRSFDLAGAYSFELTQLGNPVFLVDPTNGLYQFGAVPVPGSDSGLSYTYLEVNDATGRITLQAPEGIVLPGYGVGVHVDTPTYSLGVDASGNLIEFIAGVGSGSVTDFSFTDANGFDGTVTTSTTTPTLTLTTTLTAGSVFFAGASGAINEDNSNFFFNDTSNTLGIGTNSFTATRLQVVDNGVAGASIVKITSTSTAAASNLQRGIDVSLSGTNASGSQTTTGIYSSNTHAGSGSNFGITGTASGGTNNYGVYGTDGSVGLLVAPQTAGVAGSGVYGVFGFANVSSGSGVWGLNTHASGGSGVFGSADGSNAIGVSGSSTAGIAVRGSSDTGIPLKSQLAPSASTPSTVRTLIELTATTNTLGNVPGAGYGGNILWTIVTNNGGVTASRTAADLYARWTTITDASRTSEIVFDIVTDADPHNALVLSGPQSTLLSRDAGTNQTSERFSVVGTYKTLTESSATAFVRVNIPSGTVTGGEILITVEANDATDYQSRTLRFIWSAVNKGGTITATVQTPEEAVAVSAGTLTVTIDTNDAGSGNLDFRANAVSSLTQTVLRCSYQVFKNIGTGVITPQ